MKTITTLLAAAMMALPITSRADHGRPGDGPRHRDDGARVAGAIVAGVAIVGTIAAIANHHDRDYRPEPAYCPPPPPRPMPPVRHWVPGAYETQRERVLVPGHWTTVTERVRGGWGWGHHHGRHHERYITRRVWIPERYEWRETQVWVPGHWEMVRGY